MGEDLGDLRSLDDQPHMTAHERVRTVLRRAIVVGVAEPGQRLVQSRVADQLGVSVTPVREALRDLAGEGLVQLDAHRGATVRQFEHADLAEVQGLRAVLEPLAMRWAAERVTDGELDAAEAIQRQMDAETDESQWLELNRRFHLALIRGAHAPRLESILMSLRDAGGFPVARIYRADPVAQRARSHDEHEALLTACRHGDAEEAARLIVEHMTGTRRDLAARAPERSSEER